MTEEQKLKPCPFCGSEDIKIEIIKSNKDILIDGWHTIIDFRCSQCKLLKNTNVYGTSEEDCIKEAKRLWNRRVKNEQE